MEVFRDFLSWFKVENLRIENNNILNADELGAISMDTLKEMKTSSEQALNAVTESSEKITSRAYTLFNYAITVFSFTFGVISVYGGEFKWMPIFMLILGFSTAFVLLYNLITSRTAYGVGDGGRCSKKSMRIGDKNEYKVFLNSIIDINQSKEDYMKRQNINRIRLYKRTMWTIITTLIVVFAYTLIAFLL